MVNLIRGRCLMAFANTAMTTGGALFALSRERARKPNDDATSRMGVLNRNATSVASATARRTQGAS
jgi:hypothetical protein